LAEFGSWWGWRLAPYASLALAAVAVVSVALFVDLSPRVEGEFFFAADDPQMQASRRVAEDFPAGSQVILRVEDLVGDADAYRDRIERLTASLLVTPGVENAYSISTNDPSRSPLYARILLTPDERASNIIILVDGTDPEVLLPRIEGAVDAHEDEALDVVISGVPAIVEQIRRSLYRDLVVFSTAAVLVFALLIGLVYRDAAIVLGTLATCLASVGVTLLLVHFLDIGIGLLTANLVTIVFVLTLSHVVFLTANWRRRGSALASPPEGAGPGGASMPIEDGRRATLTAAVRETWEGSFWSMTTTLLGFASLLVATARPLRELGVAGAIGALTALIVSYALYPSFLASWARIHPDLSGTRVTRPLRGGGWVLSAATVALIVLGVGLPRVNTDPSLLTYFDEGSDLYDGLARIDRDGGSSTLDIVVEDPSGRAVSDAEVFSRLGELQVTLEADLAVGVVLSPIVLIEHARTIPLAGLLPVGMLLDIAMSDALDGVGLGFVRPDRSGARFALRMRETAGEERDAVMARLRADVEEVGLRPVAVTGLYDLQAELGHLIAASLRIGVGGLLVLFFGIALVVGRSPRAALTMWVCLAGVPVVILGMFGHLGIAMDIITSPAANIALAVGADSMIHLVVRMRRLSKAGESAPWATAVAQIGPPVVGATGIVCAGFGIFVLSSFPPTQRFGLAVMVGTVAASVMALVVLPRMACLGSPESGRLSPVTG
jgi:predicted RND superfamily exporter protein